MQNNLKITLFILFISFSLYNCEREVDIDLPQPEQKIVVDGRIESGQIPFLTLNTNFPYFGTFTFANYQNSFIHDAVIKVSDGTKEVDLTEICFSSLSTTERLLLLDALGINATTVDTIFNCANKDTLYFPTSQATDDFAVSGESNEDVDYCIYTVNNIFNPEMIGELGKTYALSIEMQDGKELSAITTIPQAVAADSLWSERHIDENFSCLHRVYLDFKDPDTLGNYYRVLTSRNQGAFYAPLRSVFDDLFVNDKQFYFPLDRGQSRAVEFDIDTYGYFLEGDTVRVQWVSIDKNTYDFWRTLEVSTNGNNPFLGFSTKVLSNIEGGIGVWAGYGIAEYEVIVE